MGKKYFADIHEGPESQMGNYPERVQDTEEITLMRASLSSIASKDERYETLLNLAKALVFQLRYKSALGVLDEAVSLDPSRNEAVRMRAIRRLYTLDLKGSLEDFNLIRERKYEDVSYQTGLCHFLSSRYDEAMKEMENCYRTADNEMKVAAMYWHAISALRLGRESSLLKLLTEDFDCGHHRAYKAACLFFKGAMPAEELKFLSDKEESDLDYSMLSYALYVKGFCGLENIIRRDSFWIGFAYVAAWNELYYDGKGRK
ncbi:MAG: hypothetical protein K5634_02295 [Sphaerochaetaceae bacterium]|nr:hypothetical protein [Sphaerochaetaceae bacterium]